MQQIQAEVQLLNWSETATGGSKVVLQVDDLDPWRLLQRKEGKTSGTRFMAVFVPIGDDDQPLPDAQPQQEERKGGPLAQLAGRWCGDPVFREWLRDEWCSGFLPDVDEAAETIRHACGISSRAELDHDARARTLFDQKFRIPYGRYLQGR